MQNSGRSALTVPRGATLAGAALATALAACQPAGAPPAAPAWRPAPIEDAPEPSVVVEQAPADAWREIEPDNLLLMDLADGSRVVIELAPLFAPVHVANIRAFARSGYWDGATIYRVQENYVVQWGINDSERPLPAGADPTPPAEYERSLAGLDVRPLGYPDSYAPLAGHAAGWPIAYDPQRGTAWLAHCYAMVGAGRNLSPDTGTGGELYTVIGHAPRHLDRNIATVGRIVSGMETLTARTRGTEALGFIKDAANHIRIARVRLAADVPDAPRFEVLRSDHPAFDAFVRGRANRGGDFFDVPAGGVDLCNAGVPVRRKQS